MSAEWRYLWPWHHPQWSCLCVLLYTWHGQVRIKIAITLFFFLVIPYSQCLHAKKPNLLEVGTLFLEFLTPKAARTTSRESSSGGSWLQGGEQSIGTSSSARIALASFNCLPRHTCIVFYTLALTFFSFFLFTNFPSVPVLVIIGLCLTLLADTNTYGFVFFSVASCQACYAKFSCLSFCYMYLGVSIFPAMGQKAQSSPLEEDAWALNEWNAFNLCQHSRCIISCSLQQP